MAEASSGWGIVVCGVGAGVSALFAWRANRIAGKSKNAAEEANRIATETKGVAENANEIALKALDFDKSTRETMERTLRRAHLTAYFSGHVLHVTNLGPGTAQNVKVTLLDDPERERPSPETCEWAEIYPREVFKHRLVDQVNTWNCEFTWFDEGDESCTRQRRELKVQERPRP